MTLPHPTKTQTSKLTALWELFFMCLLYRKKKYDFRDIFIDKSIDFMTITPYCPC